MNKIQDLFQNNQKVRTTRDGVSKMSLFGHLAAAHTTTADFTSLLVTVIVVTWSRWLQDN